MTVVNARKYVADIVGGRGSQEILDMADEALRRGYQDWQGKKEWSFLLKNTSRPFVLTATTSSNTIVTPVTAGDLDFVNVGQTLTGSPFSGTATVTAVTRGTDGVVTSVTVDLTATTTGNAALTFSADIPIKAGSNDYSLPSDFHSGYNSKFTVNFRTMTWRDQRYWDRIRPNDTVRGTPSEYTSFNPFSDLTQNFGTPHMKFDYIPDTDDLMRLIYYRKFNPDGTYVDMHDDYLYQFLDYCSNLLLARKKAQDDPANYAASTEGAAASAAQADDQPTEDNDADQCMKSQFEMGNWARLLWGNGQFDPTR